MKLRNNKEGSDKKKNKTLNNTEKTITASEVASNIQEDMELEMIVRQLTMNNDMMSKELGLYPDNEYDNENGLSEDEKKQRRKEASERYLNEREDILNQIKEKIND